MRRSVTLAVTTILSCANPPPHDTTSRAAEACMGTCPKNTRRVEVSAGQAVSQGGFMFIESSCMMTCIPERPCVLPFVPRVSRGASGEVEFGCQALQGFDLPEPSAIDFSFADKWSGDLPPIFVRKLHELIAPPPGNVDVFAADVDADRKLDLVTFGLDADRYTWHVFRNAGASFEALPGQEVIEGMPVAVADLDGDGRDDFVTRALEAQEISRDYALASLRVVFSRAGARFEVGPELDMDCLDNDMEIADRDGDGVLDLWTLSRACDGGSFSRIVVYPGLGGGRFGPKVDLGIEAQQFWTVDLDGDRRPELVSRMGASHTLHMNGAQTVIESSAVGYGFADIDGNGALDLVVTPDQIRLGDGRGGFGAPITAGFGVTLRPCEVGDCFGDFNGDGRADLLFDQNGHRVAFGRADGSTDQALDVSGTLAADLDGDGRDEIIKRGDEIEVGGFR